MRIIFIFLLFSVGSNCENSILISTPHEWLCEPSSNQSILVDFVNEKIYNNHKLRVLITDGSESQNKFQIENKISSESILKIDFKIPTKFYSSNLNLSVEIVDRTGKVVFSKYVHDVKCKKANGLFIITDKSIYRESEIVHCRILSIDSSLRPINNENASLFLIDPNGNYVEQITELKFQNGLVDNLNFQLTNRPIYGLWQIKLILNSEEYVKLFFVKEYVLPKIIFDVDIQKSILRSNPILQGQAKAKYTYGKGADGEILIEFEENTYSFFGLEKAPSKQSFLLQMFEGHVNFSLPIKLDSQYGYYYSAKITFIDHLSGENVTKTFDLQAINFEFYLTSNDFSFEQNRSNSYIIYASWAFDFKPYSFKTLEITVSQKTSYEKESLTSEKLIVKTDSNGNFPLNIDALDNTTIIEISAHPPGDSQQVSQIFLHVKYDNSPIIHPIIEEIKKLEIQWINKAEKISKDSKIKLQINKNLDNTCYNTRYMVLSKLAVMEYGTFKLCDTANLEIKIGNNYGPYSSVFVYYFDEGKNITTSSVQFELADFTNNYLNVTFSSESVKPGDLVNLFINTRKNSSVSLCIIDKSLELIEKPNELTNDDITNHLNILRSNPYYNTFNNDQSDMIFDRFGYGYWQRPQALVDMNNEGLIVLSDLESLKPSYRNFTIMAQPAFNNEILFKEDATNKPIQSESSDKVRSDFREIWIWDTYLNGDKENFSISSIIPDTITSWVLSGFSMNNQYGLAIANKTEITTFKNFFVSMILPTSVVRGEILNLQVVVFNYFDFDLKNVKIELRQTNDFFQVVLNSKREQEFLNITKNLVKEIDILTASKGKTVTFRISPKKIGLLQMTVSAKSQVAGDTEQRFIKVRTEGIEQTNAKSFLFNLKESNKTETTTITIPSNTVSESESCSIQVIGDFLGNAFNNLNKLITKPYGCGEQNMLDLTPNIYALKYLSTLKGTKMSNVDKMITDAKENIKFGYQNELKYAHKDGSFSAFGESDKSGSSWLTAFVLKSFSQANNYVTIDQNVINKAAEWLIKQQKKDGSFDEPGNVIHKNMQGGVNSNQTITAYIIISLLESKINTKQINTAVKSAVKYLEGQYDLVKNDPYAVGLVTYALQLAKSTKIAKFFSALGSFTTKTQDGKMFINSKKSDSSDIELTSYGLLIYLLRKSTSNSLLTARWLIGKSNSLGSYSSTQNTVLALQALSEFGLETRTSQKNSLKIEITQNNITTKTFYISDSNMLILQQWQLANCNRSNLKIEAIGTGSALVQTITNFNLVQAPIKKKQMFELTQTYVQIKPMNLEIETCAKSFNQSGMIVIEANLFAGYEVYKQDLDQVVQQDTKIKFAELNLDKTKVAFYLDGLDDEFVCINWKMYRSYQVDNLKPVVVRVYDYYEENTEQNILFEYQKQIESTFDL